MSEPEKKPRSHRDTGLTPEQLAELQRILDNAGPIPLADEEFRFRVWELWQRVCGSYQ